MAKQDISDLIKFHPHVIMLWITKAVIFSSHTKIFFKAQNLDGKAVKWMKLQTASIKLLYKNASSVLCGWSSGKHYFIAHYPFYVPHTHKKMQNSYLGEVNGTHRLLHLVKNGADVVNRFKDN